MGIWCLHASSFIFDRIIIKVAGNQDRHKSSDEFDFGPLVSMAHLYVFYMFFKWDLTLAHWTQVSDRCPMGYLFSLSHLSCLLIVYISPISLAGEAVPMAEWLRKLIFSAINHSPSHRYGFEPVRQTSSACRWSGVFSRGSPIFAPP